MENIDLNEELSIIIWNVYDIRVLFENNNISFTEENYEIFLANRPIEQMEEACNAQAYETLEDVLMSCKDGMDLYEEDDEEEEYDDEEYDEDEKNFY